MPTTSKTPQKKTNTQKSQPKSAAVKAPAKAPVKQSAKAPARQPAKAPAKTAPKVQEKPRGGDPERMRHQFMPYIMALIALFLFISYFIADSTGIVGGFLRNLLFGLFSGAAWVIPVLLAAAGIFWKRDVITGSLGYRLTFSLSSLTLVSVLIHAFARRGGKIAETWRIGELFTNGKEGIGGGVIGGFFGNLLLKGFGFAGTLILSFALILLLAIFIFGMTPHMFAVYIISGIREWKAGLSSRMDNAKYEREQMLADYEARRAAELAAREKQRAAQHAMQPAPMPAKRHRTVNDALTEEYEPEVPEPISEQPQEMPAEPAIDPEVFDAVMAREAEKQERMNASAENDEPPFVPDEMSEAVVVESDAPPFEVEEPVTPAAPEEKVNLTFFRREKVRPVPPPAAKELEKLEEEETVDLAKIFAEPEPEADEPDLKLTEGDIVTSAELDLMIEKSRLSPEPIVVEPEEEEDDDEPPFDVDPLPAPVKPSAAPIAPDASETYIFPPLSLLGYNRDTTSVDLSGEIQQTANKLVETLRSFNVKTKIINVSRGPTVTRYELQPEVGTKVRSIVNLVDDIALHLATGGVRIEAPIPGKEAVGIEVPNRSTSTVYIRELLEDDAFKNASSRVTTGLGMDVAGSPVFLDIAKMPHLLIAGTTGSGKSVCINSLIISMLYKARPDEVKFIMIDPKKVELNVYNGIPHLLVPVVSDPKKAAGSLHWAVTEMERRYDLIEGAGVRNLKGYNQSIANDPDAERLPQIVIIIDELADLMMMARDDVEESICRIAQKARAAGMHLVLGTQRPTVDVVTGLIKANVPSRIAFTTMSQMDSRTIIDTIGAEKLIGRGDMLYAPIGSVKPTRVQGCFVSDDEVEAVTTFIKTNYRVREYDQSIIDSIEREAQLCGNKKATISGDGDIEANDGDPMLSSAIDLAVEAGKISTSLIQRRLQLGYGRAAKLIDTMEEMGIVGPPQGQKPRDVLISKSDYMEMKLRREE